jgi:hypothetical protein
MFKTNFSLSDSEYKECKDFANKSSPTQREYRSGGTQVRNVNLIFSDTLRGKVAEVIIKKFLEEVYNIKTELDFAIYPRGEWDKADIEIKNKKFSIKSAKWFSNWLMIEKKDIDRGDKYDYYIFVTIDKEMKSGNIRGFAKQDEILNDSDTRIVKKGDLIPGTQTTLDADNHIRHVNNLHNTEDDWNEVFILLKEHPSYS